MQDIDNYKTSQESIQKICLALDGITTVQEIESRVSELKDLVGIFKVGLEAFSWMGPECVWAVHRAGGKVFLDLKLHDIPKTVERAARAISFLPVTLTTVHASGGIKMLEAARKGLDEGFCEYEQKGNTSRVKAKLIAVTVLTSIDESILQQELNVAISAKEHILSLAQMVQRVGLDGVVCSAPDLSFLRPTLGQNFTFVTPGIHFTLDNKINETQEKMSEHKRSTGIGPTKAISLGASYLVIGRGINNLHTVSDRRKALVQLAGKIDKETYNLSTYKNVQGKETNRYDHYTR